MGLLDILEQNNIPVTDEIRRRFGIVVKALRGDMSYKTDLMKGGMSLSEIPIPLKPTGDADYLGPRINWFLDVSTSPYARTLLEGLFMVIFFLSYLESIPVFGSILSATLDVMVMADKMLIKNVQAILPPMIGMIPLPYASMGGIGVAAVFGMIMWPIVAIVSFSRQDFVAAVESFIRVIPPPFGDMIANLFVESNRTAAKLNDKRVKLTTDLSSAFAALSNAASDLSSNAKEGLMSLSQQVKSSTPTIGGLHLRNKKTRKRWNRKQTRRRFAKRSASGLPSMTKSGYSRTR